MDEHRLIIQMKGADDGDVRLDDFLDFLFDLRTVLRATDRAIAHSDEPTTNYLVDDLSHSSPAMVALRPFPREPDIDLGQRVLSTFVEAVTEIKAGNAPRGFSTGLLLEYRELAMNLKGPLHEAAFTHGPLSISVSDSFRQRIEEIVGRDHKEQGEASGTIDIVNAHQRRFFFWLYPPGGERIKCYFPRRMMTEVGKAIGTFATVTGTLHFKTNMLQPYMLSVGSIDVHEEDNSLASLGQLRGAAPDATGEESSEDFIRRLRDGW